MTSGQVVRLGPDRLRVVAWRGRDDVALLTLVPDAPAPPAAAIDRCLELLVERGVHEAVTGALAPTEQAPFLGAGFTVRERLHLLSHPMRDVPEPPSGVRTRRARRGDGTAIVTLDQRCFGEFWRLDQAGLADAVAATATARVRVAVDSGIVGYAVTGRSGGRGYIQRLAVEPAHQGRGVGAALVVEGLRWLDRHGVDRVVVNTQEGNRRALDLYRRVGFVAEPEGLAVLSRRLPGIGR